MRILLLALAALPVFAASHTALDRYVAAPDPNYKYELARTSAGRGYTAFLYLTGGSVNATSTNTIAAEPRGIPNEPLRLPMTKAAVRVMDTASALEHHYQACGSGAPSLADYTNMIDRLTMPKTIVSSAGDQYFVPDSSQFYWKDLPRPQMDWTFEKDGGLFTAKIDKRDPGYTAFFIEATFPTRSSQLKLTNGVKITPDTLPSGPPPRTKH